MNIFVIRAIKIQSTCIFRSNSIHSVLVIFYKNQKKVPQRIGFHNGSGSITDQTP